MPRRCPSTYVTVHRRLRAALRVSVLALTLTACGNSSTPSSDAATSVATTAAAASVVKPDPDPKYAAAVTAAAPLSAGRNVSCEGAVGPAALLAMTGDASRGSSPTATTLRKFLANDPWHGLDGVDRIGEDTSWLLLEANAHRYVFAQRKGRVGVAAVIVFVKNPQGSFVPDHNGSCQLILDPSTEHSASISSATITGNTVSIHWLNGSCGLDAPPDEVLVRVEQIWTAAGTHLLVVTKPNPAIATMVSTGPGAAQTRWCGGVGIDSTAEATLTKVPTNGRLYDDAGIPATLVRDN